MTTSTTPIARPEPDIDVVCRRLTGDLITALRSYETAKSWFSAVTQSYERPGRDAATAETLAASDHRRQKAVADCGWFHGEAMLAATALTALRTEQAARRDHRCPSQITTPHGKAVRCHLYRGHLQDTPGDHAAGNLQWDDGVSGILRAPGGDTP